MIRTLEVGNVTFENIRIIDPASGRDEVVDLHLENGCIARTPGGQPRKIDATGWFACPGLADIHVHLREPGQTHKEDIASGTAAAAAGGFTLVACMPNTAPAIDTPDVVRRIIERARAVGYCEVAPVAATTRGREGRELTDFRALLSAGAIAFSDDGVGVEDDRVMRAAFEQAAQLDALLIQHCEFKAISAGGVMHKGDLSARLGLPGLDPRSEEAMIERDIDLCRKTGGRYHVAHISTARAIELVRRAKKEGLPVSTEVCTHHLVLTDEACTDMDPNTKMHPPLRPMADVLACRQGLVDGTIDCVVTDHAPHAPHEKSAGFLKAPAGIIGLETAVGLAVKAMVDTGMADWTRLIEWMAIAPRRVVKRPVPKMEIGSVPEMALIDIHSTFRVEESAILSKSRNTPFVGWSLPVSAAGTVRGGRLIVREGGKLWQEFTGE